MDPTFYFIFNITHQTPPYTQRENLANQIWHAFIPLVNSQVLRYASQIILRGAVFPRSIMFPLKYLCFTDIHILKTIKSNDPESTNHSLHFILQKSNDPMICNIHTTSACSIVIYYVSSLILSPLFLLMCPCVHLYHINIHLKFYFHIHNLYTHTHKISINILFFKPQELQVEIKYPIFTAVCKA